MDTNPTDYTTRNVRIIADKVRSRNSVRMVRICAVSYRNLTNAYTATQTTDIRTNWVKA